FSGEIPAPADGRDERDAAVESRAVATIRTSLEQYDQLAFSRALEAIWELVAEVDRYLVLEQPWSLAEDASKHNRLARVLYPASEALRILTVLTCPVLPQAAEKIWQQLGQRGKLSEQRMDELRWGQLKPGTRVGKPEAVFPRVDKEEAYERIEAMEQEIQPPSALAAAQTPAAPARISIEDFAKVEMRVGEVKSAERVAGADKLLKLIVDIGGGGSPDVAGIAQGYRAEGVVGRKGVVVVHPHPRQLRGAGAHRRIFAASLGPPGR